VVVRGEPPPLIPSDKRKPRGAGDGESPAITPAGQQVEDLDVPVTSDSIPVQEVPRASRRLSARHGLGAVVALAVGAGALLLSLRGDAPPAAESPSIAVLPLANVGGEQSDAAIVDGLSEELIGVLARIDNLRVVARTSAFAFRNTTLDSRQIGDSLGVSHLLEGGVQRVGDSLRIQVRLIDASDGSTKWSERYDRGAGDVFLVQSEIAAAVARQLDLQLRPRGGGRNRRPPTTSVAAYELYLRASDPANLRSDSGVRSARELFRQAIALDSNYAAAHAGLARMEMRIGGGVLSSNPNAGYEGRALAAATRAIALDDSSPEGHASLGLIRMAQYDFASAERELKMAIALDPSASRTREWLAFVYFWLDRRADALESTTRAVENDPLSPSAHAERARALCIIGRHDEGIAVLAKLKDIRPQLLRVPFFTTLCYMLKRDWQTVIARTRADSDPMSRALLGYSLARTGHRDEASRILGDLTETRSRNGRGSFEIAVLQTGLLDRDAAVESLERALNEKVVRSNVALALFEDLHGHPGYERIRARHGIQKR
jgi:TolB-like protein/Flp pilus assembly protein TadD